ncbi:hypothetical protein ACFVVX_26980 [Kitasatospora sp. NPDC058170]
MEDTFDVVVVGGGEVVTESGQQSRWGVARRPARDMPPPFLAPCSGH